MTEAKLPTRLYWMEATRDSMPCSVVVAPMMDSMHDWKRTDSIGPHQKVMRAVDGFTTLVEVGKLSIVKAAAISSARFLFGVLGINGSKPCPAFAEMDRGRLVNGQTGSHPANRRN